MLEIINKMVAIPFAVLVLNLSMWIRKIGYKPKGSKYFHNKENVFLHILATIIGLVIGIGYIMS